LRNARNRHALGCCKRKPRFVGLLNPSREGDGGDTHFLRERERHQVDDKLFGLANIRLGSAGPLLPMPIPTVAGPLPNTLKKENGAALTAPRASRVVTQAIGRGKIVASSSL
jgi:hypothetical protein